MSDYDVVVCGAGVAGLAAAMLFGAQGRRVLVVDKQAEPADTFKGELLHPGSLTILDRTGALDLLRQRGARTVNRLVSATADGRELCSMDYRWFPAPYDHCLTHTYKGIVGTLADSLPGTVELRHGVSVLRALRADDGRAQGIEIRADRTEDRIRTPLVVAADGASSKLRTQVGIEVDAIVYDHQVVAFDLVDEPLLQEQATTYITPAGMRVTYPMPDNGGRLYLQIPRGLVNRVGKAALSDWIDTAIAECPGLIPLRDSIRRALPTSRVLSARRFVAPEFQRDGMPLLGDAAHGVHPMAGQGMNAAIADAAALVDMFEDVELEDRRPTDRALVRYGVRRAGEVRTIAEFSHRFAELFTRTGTRLGYARAHYMLGRHGHNQRLCYKIMHNISGLGYEPFSVLDRLQQVGFPDRRGRAVPGRVGSEMSALGARGLTRIRPQQRLELGQQLHDASHALLVQLRHRVREPGVDRAGTAFVEGQARGVRGQRHPGAATVVGILAEHEDAGLGHLPHDRRHPALGQTGSTSDRRDRAPRRAGHGLDHGELGHGDLEVATPLARREGDLTQLPGEGVHADDVHGRPPPHGG